MLCYLQVRIILLVPARNTLMEAKVIDGSQVASIDLIAHANNEIHHVYGGAAIWKAPPPPPPPPESEMVGVALLRSKGNTAKPY